MLSLLCGSLAHSGACVPTWDSTLGVPGANARVRDAVVFDDGSGESLYVTGSFTSIGGVAALRIAKWDGVTWSPVGGGLGADGFDLLVHDFGGGPRLYVAGSFTTAGEESIARVACWDGASWSSVGGAVPDGTILSLHAHDGDVFVGGVFSMIGALPAARVARFDGSSWSALGTGIGGAGSAVISMCSHEGDLIVGGDFEAVGGVAASNVARWNGVSWSALGLGVNDLAQEVVSDSSVEGAPTLFVAGAFLSAGGAPAPRIARWDGAGWSSIGAGVDGGFSEGRSLAVFDDGDGPALYLGGSFIRVAGVDAPWIARWTGEAWESVDGGADDVVAGLSSQSLDGNTNLVVMGDFDQVGAGAAHGIALRSSCATSGSLADLNGDGVVGPADLALLLGSWGPGAAAADLNNSGAVDPADLALLLGSWSS